MMTTTEMLMNNETSSQRCAPHFRMTSMPPRSTRRITRLAPISNSHTWRDMDEATARIANLLTSMNPPAGQSRRVQTDKSVEALMPTSGVRAAYVYLPLNTAYQAAEIEYFIGNAEPAVVVCAEVASVGANPIADAAKVAKVFTLDENGQGTLTEAIRYAVDGAYGRHAQKRTISPRSLHQRHHRAQQGRHAVAPQSAVERADPSITGVGQQDVLIHALPIFHVHGLFVPRIARCSRAHG